MISDISTPVVYELTPNYGNKGVLNATVVGKIVIVNGWLTGITNMPTGWESLCSMPSGIYKDDVHFPVVGYDSNGVAYGRLFGGYLQIYTYTRMLEYHFNFSYVLP